MMHQALDGSDQTRKYGISESMIQALYYDIRSLQQSHNKGLYYGFRDAIFSEPQGEVPEGSRARGMHCMTSLIRSSDKRSRDHAVASLAPAKPRLVI